MTVDDDDDGANLEHPQPFENSFNIHTQTYIHLIIIRNITVQKQCQLYPHHSTTSWWSNIHLQWICNQKRSACDSSFLFCKINQKKNTQKIKNKKNKTNKIICSRNMSVCLSVFCNMFDVSICLLYMHINRFEMPVLKSDFKSYSPLLLFFFCFFFYL